MCIYPAYINSNKTRQEGRIVAKAKAVPNPTYVEIRDVLQNSEEGFKPIVENKQHPRERSREIQFRGRIRVQLKNDDGTPKNEKFPDRESVLHFLCEKIPQLKTRIQQQQANKGQDQQGQQANKSSKAKKGKKKK